MFENKRFSLEGGLPFEGSLGKSIVRFWSDLGQLPVVRTKLTAVESEMSFTFRQGSWTGVPILRNLPPGMKRHDRAKSLQNPLCSGEGGFY